MVYNKEIGGLVEVSVIVLKPYGFKTSNLSITIGTSPETYACKGRSGNIGEALTQF